jgi:hypothetical protein
MRHLACPCKFRVYQPLEEYRDVCPYILVTVDGAHPHPIPLPVKPPPRVRETMFKLLHNLEEDLPDVTPRRFLRHPTLKTYLRGQFPHSACPTLSYIHSSLANRSLLKSYIIQAKKDRFPFGTGWEGVHIPYWWLNLTYSIL